MNLDKLKLAEAHFLKLYPGGFEHPEMQAVGKKHPVSKMSDFAAASFAKKEFKNPNTVLENMTKLVSRSSMVSMFEKPKFRDFVANLSQSDRFAMVAAYKKLFYGKQEAGFSEILDLLSDGKIARWSLMTIPLIYFDLQNEVFVKPTTAKAIIIQLGLKELVYKPRPSWEFYQLFRSTIIDMQALVDSSLSPNNAAFTGFLMMSFSPPK
ncbi:MAG: hypothetical protein ACI9FB_003284 [Candidatus Azotimanducaceae bacterium]|jgi:hypothetical protein